MTNRSSREIEAQIQKLEAEHQAAVAEELATKETVESQKRLAEDERRKREAEARWRQEVEPFEKAARETREAEARERAEYQARMSYIASLLPDASTMPYCPEGCGSIRLIFESMPPVVIPYQRFYGSKPIPMTMLKCPNCGVKVTSKFESEYFKMSFDDPQQDF